MDDFTTHDDELTGNSRSTLKLDGIRGFLIYNEKVRLFSAKSQSAAHLTAMALLCARVKTFSAPFRLQLEAGRSLKECLIVNEKKYPLFSPKLMQVNSFAYVSRDYTPSLQEERTAGVVGCAIEEAVKNELKDYTNVFLDQFDRVLRKSEQSDNTNL